MYYESRIEKESSMKHLFNYLKKNEEGSTIIIVAFSVTLLTIIAALIIDLGIAYYKTAEVENAADAAALAAGQLLPVKVSDTNTITIVKNRAIEYAEKNGMMNMQFNNIELFNEVGGMYTQLKINIPIQIETSFAKIIGVKTLNITRSATVKITPCGKVADVVPLSIDKTKMDYYLANNQSTHLALKFGGGAGTQGAFGAIDLDGVKGGGANDYYSWLAFGFTGQLSAGEQLFPVETGTMAGPTNNALTLRYNECNHYQSSGGCTIDHFNPNCPRIVKAPVIEYDSKHYVQIRGFAAFILEPLTDSGYIYGSFIKMVVPGVPSEIINVGDVMDYGLYNVKLSN